MVTEPKEPCGADKKHRNYWIVGIAITAVAIVAVLTVCCLVYGGNDKTQWVIALFTVVMTMAIVMQWVAMIDQNRKFAQQNQHMAEQNKVMIAQNEAIEGQLEQVQLEQRAWVATSVTTHGPLSGAYDDEIELDLPITVRNEGRTPAVITHAIVNFGTAFKPDLSNLERTARMQQAIRSCVAPDDMFSFHARDYWPPPKLPKTLAEQIEAGTLEAYLAGVFIYTDTFGNEHKTSCTYKYRNGFGGHPEDGEMT
jgi:membrane protein implicated in regulation of membrane protease activity